MTRPSQLLRPASPGAALPRPEFRITGWLLRDAVRAVAPDGSASTVSFALAQPGGPEIHARRVYAGGLSNYHCAGALAARLRAGQRVTVWGHRLSARDAHSLDLSDVTLIDHHGAT